MTPEQWADLFRTVGVAAPLLALLAWLLQVATIERRDITQRFLTALQTAVEQSNESRLRSANELRILSEEIKAHDERSAEEHRRLIESMERLLERVQR